jgi:hypothetical protein
MGGSSSTNAVVRYMRVGRLLAWVSTDTIRFSSPYEWHDEIEKFWFKIVEKRLGIREAELRRKVFGACFSSEFYSEALWKRFGGFDDVVRVTIDRAALLNAVATWCKANQAVEVVETVEYLAVGKIAARARRLLSQVEKMRDRQGNEFRLRLLSLWTAKTLAFEFEQECRILIHLKKPLPKGKSPELELVARNAIRRVMFYNVMDLAVKKVVQGHLRAALPNATYATTVVNTVPKTLLALMPTKEK